MKQNNNHSLSLINGLTNITGHHDRGLLEESVLKTINDLFSIETMYLFLVQGIADDKCGGVIGIDEQNNVISADNALFPDNLLDKLEAMSSSSIASKKAESLPNKERTAWDIVYPILNVNNDVCSLLVCHCKKNPTLDEQRIVSGILHVYSNYLSLINKTQRDKLTGLFNRETLDTEITKVLMRGTTNISAINIDNEKRHSDDLHTWLGVVDIDHFKMINDTYGHLYGDEVIILVARLMMNSCVREDDLVFRYGGEEFVVMLKATTEQNAVIAFERLRQNIDNHTFPQVGNVTISIGFVEVVSQQSATDVIGMADDALYYAKENGRNQIISYPALLREGKLTAAEHVSNSDVAFF
jgi:two-component system, cell cycle response regulator